MVLILGIEFWLFSAEHKDTGGAVMSFPCWLFLFDCSLDRQLKWLRVAEILSGEETDSLSLSACSVPLSAMTLRI